MQDNTVNILNVAMLGVKYKIETYIGALVH
jgi:hypothetical protein